MDKYETTLVIGDAHSIADDPDQERFDILGDFIVTHRPDNIVQIGDFMTYDSISAHNASKRLSMEGQRLKKELQSGQQAYDLMMSHIDLHNEGLRKNKKALYKPNMFYLLGNHEDRAARYVEENPEMKGLVYFNNYFNPEDDGWVIVPYREHCEINGVLFTHIPMNGANQPLSSVHLGRKVLEGYACSIVYGHTHYFACETEGVKTTDGYKKITSLNVGCYFDHKPEYARTSKGIRRWWSGLVKITHLNNEGDFDFQTYSLETLRK